MRHLCMALRHSEVILQPHQFVTNKRLNSNTSGSSGFGTAASKRSKASRTRRKPGKANHRREQCPLGRDPELDAIKARQSLGLPLTGRLKALQVKQAHKLLAVQHHPDKGGDPEMMTRFNNARDVLLEPVMENIASE